MLNLSVALGPIVRSAFVVFSRMMCADLDHEPSGRRAVGLDAEELANDDNGGAQLVFGRAGIDTYGPLCRTFDLQSARFPHVSDAIAAMSDGASREKPEMVPTRRRSPCGPDDMVMVEPPCHPAEPLKVPEDATGSVHCLVCGTALGPDPGSWTR